MYCEELIALTAQHLHQGNGPYLRVAVLASGHGSNFQALVDHSKNGAAGFEIATLIVNNPKAFVIERAKSAGINCLVIDHHSFTDRADFEQKMIEHLHSLNIQLVALAGFMRVLGPTFINSFAGRIVNIHPSILPKYKGLKAIEKAYSAGEKEVGCSVHLVNEGVDTGAILAQKKCAVVDGEGLDGLSARVHQLEHEIFPEVISKIARRALSRA